METSQAARQADLPPPITQNRTLFRAALAALMATVSLACTARTPHGCRSVLLGLAISLSGESAASEEPAQGAKGHTLWSRTADRANREYLYMRAQSHGARQQTHRRCTPLRLGPACAWRPADEPCCWRAQERKSTWPLCGTTSTSPRPLHLRHRRKASQRMRGEKSAIYSIRAACGTASGTGTAQ